MMDKLLLVSLVFLQIQSTVIGVKILPSWKTIVQRCIHKFNDFAGAAPSCIMDARQVHETDADNVELYFCPPILLWDPLNEIRVKSQWPLLCPDHYEPLVQTDRWMNGSSSGRYPRMAWDINGPMILVAREYECPVTLKGERHRIRTTDSKIILLYGVPRCDISLTHKFCFTKGFLSAMNDYILAGMSFHQLSLSLHQRAQDFIAQAANKAMHGRGPNESGCCTEIADDVTKLLCKSIPDEETLKRVFNSWNGLNREFYDNAMRARTATALMADHTFKVTFNIGIHREGDNKWMKQYNSLFVVMNEFKEVVSWQLCKGEKFDLVSDMLKNLKDRETANVKVFVIDNCCKWEKKLKDLFGEEIQVKLDLFHAVQRLTAVLEKGHKYHSRFCKSLRRVFRERGDTGEQRTMATPSSSVLRDNLLSVISEWEATEAFLDGPSLLTAQFRTAVGNLLKHIEKGCLSGIPAGFTTGMNENLHKNMNRIFKGVKMGPELALNLLTLFFYVWNCKICLSKHAKKVHESVLRIAKFAKDKSSEEKKETFGIRATKSVQNPDTNDTSNIELYVNSVDERDNPLWLQKCCLFKRLCSLSRTDIIDIDFLFCEAMVKKILQLPSARNTANYVEGIDSLRNRCANFGFLVTDTIPVDRKDSSNIISVLALTIAEYIIANENYSSLKTHFDNLGLSNDANRNCLKLITLINHSIKNDMANDGNNVDQDRMAYLSLNENKSFEIGFADIVLQAVSNTLGIPLLLFTSLEDVPMLPVFAKRPISTTQWLFLGISFKENVLFHKILRSVQGPINQKEHVEEVCYEPPSSKKSRKTCLCGAKRKGNSAKCTTGKYEKYKCRCPCFKAEQPCTYCCCVNCNNPFGKSTIRIKKQTRRQRSAPQITTTQTKGSEFLMNKDSTPVSEPWSSEETFLLKELVHKADSVNNLTQITESFNKEVVTCRFHCDNLNTKTERQIRSKIDHSKKQRDFVMAKIAACAKKLMGAEN